MPSLAFPAKAVQHTEFLLKKIKIFFSPFLLQRTEAIPSITKHRRSCWTGSSTALPHPNKLGLTHHLLTSSPCCCQGLSSSCPQAQAAPSSRRGRGSYSATDLWQRDFQTPLEQHFLHLKGTNWALPHPSSSEKHTETLWLPHCIWGLLAPRGQAHLAAAHEAPLVTRLAAPLASASFAQSTIHLFFCPACSRLWTKRKPNLTPKIWKGF